MQRLALHISLAVVTFIAGVGASKLVHQERVLCRLEAVATNPPLPSNESSRFIAVSSLLEPDYHIYWYRTTASDDPEEITLYGDFRSAQVTHEHFESNATTDAAKLLERGSKFDENGQKIGKRGVTLFTINQDVHAVRIFWTEGDIFWSVQAPSLELAREFEESEVVHSITMSNKRLQLTAR
jgi:hypothetical protein